jgi:argininosuccinate lyase
MAGAGFPVDRKELAKNLGFSALSANSIDGVSSRDFALETLSAVATLAVNLSRYAEDLIVWASQEFSFIEIDDAWSTGSSMMPQKKNPDSLELIRGKCGRFIGNHTRFAVTLKGVGLSYCKDLQEDKEPVIDSITQIKLVLQVFTRVIATLKIQEESIAGKMDSLLFATDLADYLVNKNLPFRQAHRIVGRIVRYCLSESLSLDSVSLEKYREFCELFDRDLYTLFNWKKALAHRDIYGGTGPRSLKKQIETALKLMKS